jgi:hypothetical protein
LLVYGNNAGSAVATLLTDDNRVPSDGISVKLRLINGITGSVGALTLAANNNLVGNGIAPGAASDYATVPVTYNPVQLNFNAALKPNLFATAPTSVFSVNSVYTILAGGDVGAPQLTIR